MKIIVKTLSGKQLPLEIEADWTVRKVKEQIEAEHELKADSLKLIAYGKVLDSDDKAVSEYSIKEGDFIVAMVQKAKAVKKPAPVEEKKEEDAKMEESPATNTAATTVPATASTGAAAAETTSAAATESSAAATTEALSPEVEAAVNELIAISGKPREMCIQALTAAHNVPDIAFEFLMSGHIP
jgi:hypothetical protein